MKKYFSASVVGFIMVFSTSAFAVPTLQLDILSGHYDTATETTIANTASFKLRAILFPEGEPGNDSLRKATLLDTFYISIALMPKTYDSGDYGSFTLNGGTINVTGDMYYGVPPFEAILAHDGKDLGKHSIFETYFKELSFSFPVVPSNLYNTQDTNKSLVSGVAYYKEFNIDVTNLDPGYSIHFDLYSKYTKSNGDIDIIDFAPFSHDAQSGPPVPEPGTMVLLGSGLVGLAGWGRKKFRK